jgi:tight adherence protein C
MSPLMLGIVIFVLLALVVVCVATAMVERASAFEDRLTEIGTRMRVAYGTLEAQEIESSNLANALFRWALKRVPEPTLETPEVAKVAKIMVQAGYRGAHAMHVFMLIRIASTVGVTLVGVAICGFEGWSGLRPIMMMIGGAALGSWLPLQIVTHRARSRRNEIAGQLSNVLDLLVVCVDAGLGIAEAIKMVGSESARQGQLIGRELAMVSAELNAGTGLGFALRAFADRTDVEDIKPLAATMIQSEQLGSRMGPALHALSDSLRDSRRMRAEEAAQKTTVKILFPLVFFILPAMMIVIVGPAMMQIIRAMSQSGG